MEIPTIEEYNAQFFGKLNESETRLRQELDELVIGNLRNDIMEGSCFFNASIYLPLFMLEHTLGRLEGRLLEKGWGFSYRIESIEENSVVNKYKVVYGVYASNRFREIIWKKDL